MKRWRFKRDESGRSEEEDENRIRTLRGGEAGLSEERKHKRSKKEKQMIDFQNTRLNMQAYSICTQTQQPVNEVRENQQ